MPSTLDDSSGVAPDSPTTQATRTSIRRPAARPVAPSVAEPDYVPPDFSGSRQIRIGASFIEQFVVGHDAGDVLRELVQNEFDGGGDVLTLTFGSRSLEVIGSGRKIDARGWDRLSVIVGTGNVMGSGRGEVVPPKENGIGSKNFGLRSLFRFGDAIHVRSGGKVALLDLQTQETGHAADPASRSEKGVRIHVPYRHDSTDRLEAFSPEREEHALRLMAAGLPDTLVKLALSGRKRGLRKVQVNSIRTGRQLRWNQDAAARRCRLAGVSMVARKGKLSDGETATRFEEEEFSRAVDIPAAHQGRRFPAYFRLPGNRLKVAVSLSISRKRVDLQQHGHFYYPLKAPSSRTGCAISVSAPFELNTDRSGLIDHLWNDWLIDQAVSLTIELLKTDWIPRYGADAFKALVTRGPASPDRFATKIAERLAADACWPTLAKDTERFATASSIVLPSEVEFGGFLSDQRYLDPSLAGDKDVCDLLARCGAARFTLGSLIRLRCAGEDSAHLTTKVKGEANFFYRDYEAALLNLDRQKRMAAALSTFSRRLSKQHKADIAKSSSTLNATGALRPAAELLIVAPDLWADCPEPDENRLHPDLVGYKAISDHCRRFDEDRWLIDAAERAGSAPDDREREILYRKLLAREAPLSRAALAALRTNPVVKNQRGDWVAPADMVNPKRQLARFLDPAIDTPAPELIAAPTLLSRLRIRDALNGADLVRYAQGLVDRPGTADRFEKLLGDHLKLLTPGIVEMLHDVVFLKSRSGPLAAPADLHLDTPTNRLCIGDNSRIVGGTNELLYRKLKVKAAPDSDTLLDILADLREEGVAPDRPDLLYPALVDAIARERRAKTELANTQICWVGNAYHAPSAILVGSRIPAPLADAIPVYRHTDEVGRAYQDLGAPSTPGDTHWSRFFRSVGTDWEPDAPVDQQRRRLLLEAFKLRGALGLPTGLDDIACLIDDRSRLYTPAELDEGLLVEPDFPALQAALHEADSDIGVIEATERSRAFYATLGIRPLSALAGAGAPVMGAPDRAPFWFKPKLGERVLAILHRPLFAWALREVAYRNRYGQAGFAPSDLATIEARLTGIHSIDFFQTIDRRYSVGGATVLVPAQLALDGERLGIVPPKNKTAFQLLLAEALAEIAGAISVATMRGIANAFLPLLLCGTQEELVGYLDMIGISHRYRAEEEDLGLDLDFDDDEIGDDAEELAVRQVLEDLNTDGPSSSDPVEPVDPPAPPPQPPAPTPTPSPSPPPFQLPNLDEVSLTIAETRGATIEPRHPGPRSGGTSGGWLPPTPDEIARAGQLGSRGEALVYRMEIERVRAMGYAEPERYVVWTSRNEPGADHDIRSIDAEGRPRWLEVKSTTGSDGRFEWPRQEFEKALRERDRYELWRVYRVSERNPTAKCFPNPARLLGTRQIALELAGLRANIEDMN